MDGDEASVTGFFPHCDGDAGIQPLDRIGGRRGRRCPAVVINYVEDRRDLLTVAAEIFESEWQPPELEPGRWRDSLRSYCRDLRAHYRRHPGMTTLALTENITMARHPTMLRNVDALIGFFESVGLSLQDAYRACMETIRLVVGFVELQDILYGHPPIWSPRTWNNCRRRGCAPRRKRNCPT
nr:TetR/AcrR family transcriptional regulator C-terminal domain-containing protein [Streptomyces flaveus]